MKPTLKVILVIFAVSILFVFFTYFLPQETQCRLETLILTEKMMPMGWTRSGQVVPPVLPKHGAQDALGVVYENGSDIAQDKIYRYKNAVLAFFFFRVNNQLFFPSGQWRWSDLDGKDGWGLNGDQKRIQCGYSDDPLLGHLCVAVVRYGPFISEFSSPIEEGIMTYEEFKAIVHAIDEQITSCLQKSRNQR